jgi:dTDP-glucose 4,6-dehydratase
LSAPKILVTGGLGFIGSNFIRQVHEKSKFSSIVNLDAVSYGAVRRNLDDIEGDPSYEFVEGSTTDRRLVEKLLADVDIVVHFAAETHVDRSIANPESFLHSNVVGTFTLLEAARRSGVKKFVHISTDEVYGSASGASFRESDRLQTSSPYSASKAAADMFVEACNKTYGMFTAILRCTNNFGPHQLVEKFIPKTIVCALLGKRISIYGSGMQVRDWIYVRDFCEAVDLAIEKGESGSIYNVSAGNELPNLELAKLILELLQRPIDLIQFVKDRPGHDFRYSLDSSRIRSELGWKPRHDFRESLRDTVRWYVDNETWWRPLINERILSPTPWEHKW